MKPPNFFDSFIEKIIIILSIKQCPDDTSEDCYDTPLALCDDPLQRHSKPSVNNRGNSYQKHQQCYYDNKFNQISNIVPNFNG